MSCISSVAACVLSWRSILSHENANICGVVVVYNQYPCFIPYYFPVHIHVFLDLFRFVCGFFLRKTAWMCISFAPFFWNSPFPISYSVRSIFNQYIYVDLKYGEKISRKKSTYRQLIDFQSRMFAWTCCTPQIKEKPFRNVDNFLLQKFFFGFLSEISKGDFFTHWREPV